MNEENVKNVNPTEENTNNTEQQKKVKNERVYKNNRSKRT